MGVEVAQHKTASVEEDDDGPVFAWSWVVDADIQITGVCVDHAIRYVCDGFGLPEALGHEPHSFPDSLRREGVQIGEASRRKSIEVCLNLRV
jgi:hypothetical protein